MVVTRGMSRRFAEERLASYNRGVAAREAWRASRARMTRMGRRDKRYRPNDSGKRHRLPDDEEKTETVVSYKRRKG